MSDPISHPLSKNSEDLHQQKKIDEEMISHEISSLPKKRFSLLYGRVILIVWFMVIFWYVIDIGRLWPTIALVISVFILGVDFGFELYMRSGRISLIKKLLTKLF